MRALKIATRQSALALWQARHVAQLLTGRFEVSCELVELSTRGDRFLSAPLSQIGGKGLFVKEIEHAVSVREADLAVHSLKDMTSVLPEGLVLACVPGREDPRDAFVGRTGPRLFDLPQGARVGTSSLRRASQILERRPDIQVVPLRGNVQTRIRKIEDEQLDGAVLAHAGLLRLGLADKATQVLGIDESLPAVGQGVLGIECRADDDELLHFLSQLEDSDTRVAITAERAFLARLEGGCTVPLAGHATVRGGEVQLTALLGAPDGSRVLRAQQSAPRAGARALGVQVAERLLEAGGAELLAQHGRSNDIPES